MSEKEQKNELERAQHAKEIGKINRQAKFEAINDYIAFITERLVAFGATGIGFSEYISPEWISFLSISSDWSLTLAGTGIGLLGGPKISELLKRFLEKS